MLFCCAALAQNLNLQATSYVFPVQTATATNQALLLQVTNPSTTSPVTITITFLGSTSMVSIPANGAYSQAFQRPISFPSGLQVSQILAFNSNKKLFLALISWHSVIAWIMMMIRIGRLNKC